MAPLQKSRIYKYIPFAAQAFSVFVATFVKNFADG
jgi:hypothetical protein